jgi:hypothetical protein
MKKDSHHGGPYDRGAADSYYRRGPNPHYYEGKTYMSRLVPQEEMTQEELEAYHKGYLDNEKAKDFKEYD